MLFAFDWSDMRGDNVEVAAYEGAARIERGGSGGWHIAGIDLRGWQRGVGEAVVPLAKDDPLYTRIALHLQQTKHGEIGAAWAEFRAEQKAEAAP